jgi:hypothetical protein
MAPGDEEVATLTLVNSGSLPAKFQGFITIANEAAGSEEGLLLADTLDVTATVTGIRDEQGELPDGLPVPPYTVPVGAGTQTLRWFVKNGIGAWDKSTMDVPFGPGSEYDLEIKVKLPKEAGNEYQGASVTGLIKLLSTPPSGTTLLNLKHSF